MLFLLFSSLADEVSPFNVFRYQTSRTGLSIITALIFVFLFGPRIISLLKVKQGRGQPIRSDGPQRHIIEKQGTPTMGGLMILSGIFVGTLLWAYYQLSGELFPAQLLDANGKVIADRVFPYFLTTKIPVGLAGIFMAALMSAAMSTMSSDLNCLSAVGVEDYYRKLRPNSTDKQRLFIGKIIVAVSGALAVAIGAFIARKGDSALALYYAATAIVSAGLAGMFLLAFLSRRANRQGLWCGLIAALIFTAWATLTGGKYKMLDLGWNYTWPDVMLGVIAHVIVLVVGWLASFGFPAPEIITREMTLWGWLEKRKTLPADKIISAPVTEVGA